MEIHAWPLTCCPAWCLSLGLLWMGERHLQTGQLMAIRTGTSIADRVVGVFTIVGLGLRYMSVLMRKSQCLANLQDDAPMHVLGLEYPHKVEPGNPVPGKALRHWMIASIMVVWCLCDCVHYLDQMLGPHKFHPWSDLVSDIGLVLTLLYRQSGSAHTLRFLFRCTQEWHSSTLMTATPFGANVYIFGTVCSTEQSHPEIGKLSHTP